MQSFMQKQQGGGGGKKGKGKWKGNGGFGKHKGPAFCPRKPCTNPKCKYQHKKGQQKLGKKQQQKHGQKRKECHYNPCTNPKCTFSHTRGQKKNQKKKAKVGSGLDGGGQGHQGGKHQGGQLNPKLLNHDSIFAHLLPLLLDDHEISEYLSQPRPYQSQPSLDGKHSDNGLGESVGGPNVTCREVKNFANTPARKLGKLLNVWDANTPYDVIMVGGVEQHTVQQSLVPAFGVRMRASTDAVPRDEWQRLDGGVYMVGHSAVYSPKNSQVYIFGGAVNGRKVSNQFVSYHVASGDWKNPVQATGKPPRARTQHSSALLDSPKGPAVIIHGGLGANDEPLNDMFAFFVNESKWSRVNSKGSPPGRCGHSMHVWQQRQLVVFGGMDQKECKNDVFILDIRKQNWRRINTKGKSPPPRAEFSAELVDNLLVVVGGRDRPGSGAIMYNDGIWILDLRTKTWTNYPNQAPLPLGRAAMTRIQSYDGQARLLLAGGVGSIGQRALDTVYEISISGISY